jgi:gliding motility-associated-like protein
MKCRARFLLPIILGVVLCSGWAFAQTPPPNILTQPTALVNVCKGSAYNHGFTASGSPVFYQWYITGPPGCEFCSTPLNNGGGYSGVLTNTLFVNTSFLAAGTYYYYCEAYNAGGSRYTNTIRMNVLPTPTGAPGVAGASRCGTGSMTLSASGAVSPQYYNWYTASSGPPIAGQTSSTYVTPVLSTSTTYYVAIVNTNGCPGPRSPVTAQVVNVTPPTTTGGSRCGPGNVTLSASGGSAGQYRWYTASTGGPAISGQTNSTYTPSPGSTTTYYVAINNGTCESSRTSVTATINIIPGAPLTTGASRCGAGTLTLTASGGAAGQYRWYNVSTGGTPIPGQNNNSYTTPVLPNTTPYYVAINNGICESSRTTVTATVNTIPGNPSTTGSSSCGSGTLTLSATGGPAGHYRWYTTSTGGSPIPGQTNATYTTPTLITSTTYYVAVNNGSCESGLTSVLAQINTIPEVPSTTGGSVCGSGTVTLGATGGTAGQYRWYTEATGGTPVTNQTEESFLTPALNATTTFYVALHNGSCESARAAATATVVEVPAAPTVTGAQGCNAQLTLIASGASAGQYRWYSVPTGGQPITGVTDGTFIASVPVTTTFYVAIATGVCESIRVPVTAMVPASCNQPPVIETVQEVTTIGSTIIIDLLSLISDPNDNLDMASLAIVSQPQSGARASIDATGGLTIDYTGTNFAGLDKLTISICDFAMACSEQELSILVDGAVNVYNAVSPNGDGKNDLLILENIDVFPTTRENVVVIYNRWGDEMVSFTNYNNKTRVFNGLTTDGKQVPAGTYFYKIRYSATGEMVTGYFLLRK